MTEIRTRLIASLADRCVIERELGAGGMATVYLARDARHDREGGEAPGWSPDGKVLYYVANQSIVGASVVPGPTFQVTGRKIAVEEIPIDLNGTNVNWDIHPNGREFLYIDETSDPDGGRFVWIPNWTELLRASGRR